MQNSRREETNGSVLIAMRNLARATVAEGFSSLKGVSRIKRTKDHDGKMKLQLNMNCSNLKDKVAERGRG